MTTANETGTNMSTTDARLNAENQRICAKLVEREVLHCISATVSHFAQNDSACVDGVDYDDVLSLCQKDDWETPGRYYVENDMDRDDLVDYCQRNLLVTLDDDDQTDLDDKALRALVIDDVSDWQEFCDENSIDPEQVEAYEHWAVTSWFKNKLAQNGEIVGELLDFDVWGRCTTGQSISMDEVIWTIANDMEILVGQKHSWADK